jgi:hypothetical protein
VRAKTRPHFEQRAMPGANEMSFVLGQEMVGECLQWDELMRTAIDISPYAACRFYDDNVQLVFA